MRVSERPNNTSEVVEREKSEDVVCCVLCCFSDAAKRDQSGQAMRRGKDKTKLKSVSVCVDRQGAILDNCMVTNGFFFRGMRSAFRSGLT